MGCNDIPPFYFPTTVVFVDNSRDFLENLSLKLDTGLAFCLYDSPVDALVELNGRYRQEFLVERFFSLFDYSEELSLSHHVIDLNLDKIVREVHNERRFEQVSVVVVDYDMPEIDGLELCRNIRNPAMKKVLLTGKADEKVAVQAFNQGIIDRFILKQDEDVIPILKRAIADLQRAYFQDLGRMLMDALALGSHPFLRDPAFSDVFRQLCTKLNIVEFYLSGIPEGILLLDADGKPYFLLVSTEEDLVSHYETAYDQAAPQELLDALRSNEVVPYFWKTGWEYSPQCGDWRSYLHPATEVQGREWYYYAVVEQAPGFQLDKVRAYNAFLDWLDQQGRTGLPRQA